MSKEEDIKQVGMELWDGFLDLCERYSQRVNIPNFSSLMLGFVFKLMFDSAPNKEVVKKIADRVRKVSYEWHLTDKEQE